jgi:hypothetical protein
MIYKFLTALRTAIGQEIIDQLSAGAGAPTIQIYTAPQPAGPATAISTQTLLGTLTCSDPVGTVTSGVITFGAITQDSSADNTGTAAWARLKDGDGNAIMDIDVTVTAGSGALKLNTVDIIAGGPIAITSFAITVGGA